MTVDVIYKLEVPWETGIEVSHALCNITADATSVEMYRGRDYASQLTGRSAAGRFQAILKNQDGKYSYANPLSVLAGFDYFRNGIPFQFSAGIMVGGFRKYYVLWRGSLDTLVPSQPTGRYRTAELNGIGELSRLVGTSAFNLEGAIAPGTDLTGTWIQAILTILYPAIQLPAGCYDEGQTTTGHFFAESESAMVLTRQLEDVEMGMLYEEVLQGGSAERTDDVDIMLYGFADRHRRLVAPRSQSGWTDQVTFSDNPAVGLHYTALEVSDPLKEVFNRIQVEVVPVRLAGTPRVQYGGPAVTKTGAAVATLTSAYTVPDHNNRLLRVTAITGEWESDAPTGVTYNGEALTLRKHRYFTNFSCISVWYLVAPPVGTADVVVTWAAARATAAIAIEDYHNVDQDTPYSSSTAADGAMGHDTAPTVSTVGVEGGLIVDSVLIASNIPKGPLSDDGVGDTLWSIATSNNWILAGGSKEAGIGDGASSWKLGESGYWLILSDNIHPATMEGSLLWTHTGDTPTLAPGETKWFTAQYPNVASGPETGAFVSAWTTPVAGVDILVSGIPDSYLSITAFKKPNQMSFKITNDYKKRHAILDTVSARGVAWIRGQPTMISASDQDSIDAYGQRSYKIPAKWLAGIDQAQRYCDYVLSRHKDPSPVLELTFVASKDDDHMLQAVTGRLGDRVTVVNDNAGIDADFYIEHISHRVTQGKTLHVTTYELSAVAGDGTYWVLGTGKLGTTTKLGY